MKKILGLLVLISGLAVGQEMDTVMLDTTKAIPNYFGGVYLDVGIMLAPNPPGINQTDFFGGGIQYNKWSLGFLVYNFKGTTQRFLIFPNVFELEYRYAGPHLSFHCYKYKWVDIVVLGSYSRGDMTWRNTEDGEDYLRSEFSILSFAAKLEAGKWRYLRPYIKAGYQQMSDLDLAGLENEEFSGFFFGVGLRVGYFNQ